MSFIVPLKQTALIHKPDVYDDWGDIVRQPSYELICRAVERTEVVKNQQGQEVVSSVKIRFDRMQDIRYDDAIEYTNEIGVTIKRKPLSIGYNRWFDGKAVFTVVHL